VGKARCGRFYSGENGLPHHGFFFMEGEKNGDHDDDVGWYLRFDDSLWDASPMTRNGKGGNLLFHGSCSHIIVIIMIIIVIRREPLSSKRLSLIISFNHHHDNKNYHYLTPWSPW